MGGTFDPIHVAHLMIAEYAKDEYELDKIIFIPTGTPPHKDECTDSKIRYDMVSLAVEDNVDFEVTDIETNRTELSYSVDTINELKGKYSGSFYFIIGSDTLFQLKTWKKIDELSKNVEFICAVRPEYISTKALEMELLYLKSKYNTKINIIKSPLYELSSTYIRERIQTGKSVKYLLPDKVIKYIEEHKLYRGLSWQIHMKKIL